MSSGRNLVSESVPASLITRMLKGAAAGWFATAPMTLFMELAWRLLPVPEKYPLPPRIITNKLRKRWASRHPYKQTGETRLTLLFHFMFGAAAGVIYGAVEDKISAKSYLKGIAAGLIVWSGSYLGWLPATRILPSALQQPWRRTMLMILAHVIWGFALGWAMQKLDSDENYIRL